MINALRNAGHAIYDFRNPKPGNNGFQWSEIDENWQCWDKNKFIWALNHEVAVAGYRLDWNAMCWADACVLVMPCGRSAHLEAGYFVGAGKPLYILLSDGEPELMYKMATFICTDLDEILKVIPNSIY